MNKKAQINPQLVLVIGILALAIVFVPSLLKLLQPNQTSNQGQVNIPGIGYVSYEDYCKSRGLVYNSQAPPGSDFCVQQPFAAEGQGCGGLVLGVNTGKGCVSPLVCSTTLDSIWLGDGNWGVCKNPNQIPQPGGYDCRIVPCSVSPGYDRATCDYVPSTGNYRCTQHQLIPGGYNGLGGTCNAIGGIGDNPPCDPSLVCKFRFSSNIFDTSQNGFFCSNP